MNSVFYSDEESLNFGLRFGRILNFDTDKMEEILDEIFRLNLDAVRLKVALSSPKAFSIIEDFGFYHSIHSILVRQSISLDRYEGKHKFNERIKFKRYTPSKQNNLKELVNSILKNDTAMYYENDISNSYIKKELIAKSIADYQTKFHKGATKNKTAFLAYYEGVLMGFSSLVIKNNKAEGDYVGILPNYRSKDFFQDFIHKQLEYSKQSNCKEYSCNTVLFNPRSLNSTLKEGLKISEAFLNLNFFPFLNKNLNSSKTLKANTSTITSTVLNYLFAFYKKELKVFSIKKIKQKIRIKFDEELNWTLLNSYRGKQTILYVFYDEKKQNYGFVELVKD